VNKLFSRIEKIKFWTFKKKRKKGGVLHLSFEQNSG